MFVKCIAPFGEHALGDVTEIPDGSAVTPYWFAECDQSGNLLVPSVADGGAVFPPIA